MREISHPGEPSISTTGGIYSESSLVSIRKAIDEFSDKGIRLEVMSQEGVEKGKVKIRIVGEEPKVGLSNFWKRVDVLKSELLEL